MVEIREVKTKREQREFLDFPNRLYRDNPCYIPPLYMDEKKIFRPDYVYYDTCEAVYFNAYRQGHIVGRISGILQKAANEKNNERRIRFTRFDCINDQEVADALFKSVEDWGISKGMDTICGPLGFSDLEREGLLVEGFDQISTFEESYNASYYSKLIENCGYSKEIDWVESKIYYPDDEDNTMEKMSDFILKRYNLHIGEAKSTRDFIKRYGDAFFELLDVAYEDLYGTVPFTDGMKKMMIDNFLLIIKLKYVAVILDENNKVVALGLCFPAIGEGLRKSGGRLTPAALLHVLHDMKKPRVLELGLVAVDPAYANRGISTVLFAGFKRMLKEVDHAETNLNLETNHAIQNQWKRFKAVQHKRRRSYIKVLGGEK